MTDFVLVRHDNGIIAPVARTFAELRELPIIEGDAVRPDGRLVRPVRENGRPVKKRTTVSEAATKTAAKKTTASRAADEKAVTPPEGAAETTLTTPKE